MGAKNIIMKKYQFIALLIFILGVKGSLSAQKFQGGLILGFNASQIDGDQLAGYHKLGFNTGIGVSYDLENSWQLNIDFLFSQRGSHSRYIRSEVPRSLTLNYIELPIYASYRDWYIEDDDFYKIQGFAGLSLGRLFGVRNSLGDPDIEQDNFLKNDIGYLLGAKFFFNRHWGISGRYTRSITRMYKHPDDGTKSLLGYFLNFGFIYKF